jgi:hypothetical protein
VEVMKLSNDDIQDLKSQIQLLREKLKGMTINHKLTDPEVIGASQLLDALLVEYEKLMKKKYP